MDKLQFLIFIIITSVARSVMNIITPPPIGSAEHCYERLYVCLSVCVSMCLSTIISFELHIRSLPYFVHASYGRGSVLHWWRSDTLRNFGFVDDAIFAHKLTDCSTSPPG